MLLFSDTGVKDTDEEDYDACSVTPLRDREQSF